MSENLSIKMWIYKFNIRKEEYGEEEKWYLIMKNFKHYCIEFDVLEDHIRLLLQCFFFTKNKL